jgi:predicted amidohydrolase
MALNNSKLTIGLAQYSMTWEDKETNKETISRLIAEKSEHLDILILPELSLTAYSMRAEKLAEELYGPTYQYFAGLAAKYQSDIAYGVILVEDGRYYNALVYITNTGECAAVYKKVHPFSYAKENLVYTGGESPVSFERYGITIGLSICYDIRFPELFRQYGKKRAELIINIANWPTDRKFHWQTLTTSRAIENQAYVAAVNRCGVDPKVEYCGTSRIVAPMGNVLCEGGDGENIYSAAIDLLEIKDVRTRYPFLDDMKLL